MLWKQILRLGSKEMFLNQVKNILASQTQSLLPKRMFLSLATQGNMSGNNVSATMFLSLARPLYGCLWEMFGYERFQIQCLVEKLYEFS